MAVTTKFTGDESDLLRAQTKIAQGAAHVTNEYRAGVKAAAELESATKRIWRETATPQEQYQKRMEQINTLYQSGSISATQYHKAVGMAQDKLNAAIKVGTISFQQMSAAVGGVSLGVSAVTGLINTMIAGLEESLNLHKQLEAKTRTTQEKITGFVSMQPAGTASGRLSQVMAATRGSSLGGNAPDVAQSFQSAASGTDPERFAFALSTLKELVGAERIGLPADLGGELAIQGMELGLSPGEMLRMAVAAGDASKRSPKEIGRAAQSIKSFDDPAFGMAIVGKLVAANPTNANELAQSTAKMLTGVSPIAPWFASQGLAPDASMGQRLAMMSAKGIDTPEELAGVGVSEDLARRALLGLLKTKKDTSEVWQIEQDVKAARSDLGLFTRKQAKNEADVGTLEFNRRILEEESKRDEWQGMSMTSQKQVLRDRILSNNLRNMGLDRDQLGEPLFDPEGNMRYRRWPGAVALDFLMRDNRRLVEKQRVDEQVEGMLIDKMRQRPAVPKAEH